MKASRSLQPLTLACLLLLVGCTGYESVRVAPEEQPTVAMVPVRNEAYLPGFAPTVQERVRHELLRSRTVRLVNEPAEADRILALVLADYQEAPLSFESDDTGIASSAETELTVRVRLENPGTQSSRETVVRVREPVFADSGSFVGPLDQSQTILAGKIAREVRTWVEQALR